MQPPSPYLAAKACPSTWLSPTHPRTTSQPTMPSAAAHLPGGPSRLYDDPRPLHVINVGVIANNEVNHVWSIDTTTVLCWGLWSLQIPVAIDYFFRKVAWLTPLEGPDAGWIIEALELTMRERGVPHALLFGERSP